jgi:hypothetical protein
LEEDFAGTFVIFLVIPGIFFLSFASLCFPLEVNIQEPIENKYKILKENIGNSIRRQAKLMRRHGGAIRILSLELLGFKNLLSPASLYSRVKR